MHEVSPEGGCYGGKYGDNYLDDFSPDAFVVFVIAHDGLLFLMVDVFYLIPLLACHSERSLFLCHSERSEESVNTKWMYTDPSLRSG
jgi:hypothetical protein